jgi:hypothetical protein
MRTRCLNRIINSQAKNKHVITGTTRPQHSVPSWVIAIESTAAHPTYSTHFNTNILQMATSLLGFQLKYTFHTSPQQAPPIPSPYMITLTIFDAVRKFRSFLLCTFLHSLRSKAPCTRTVRVHVPTLRWQNHILNLQQWSGMLAWSRIITNK